MTKKEIATLVDRAYELSLLSKQAKMEYDHIKKSLVVLDGVTFAGKMAVVKFSPHSTTVATVEDLRKMLDKIGRPQIINKLTSVRIADTRKALGEEVFSGMSETFVVKKGKMSVKKNR